MASDISWKFKFKVGDLIVLLDNPEVQLKVVGHVYDNGIYSYITNLTIIKGITDSLLKRKSIENRFRLATNADKLLFGVKSED